jgi:glycosyltransferase involved in cell wall biosynthesis
MNPTVTILTPSFNQVRYLPAALQSVRDQDYQPIEHLVLDGGSTDGSVELLRKWPGIQWVSGPDGGQVAALNHGFTRASGSILAWLNSDDLLEPDAVRRAVAALEHTGADAVYGDVRIVDENNQHLRWSRGVPFDLPTLLYGINYIGQQTVFFRRELLARVGPLRVEFDNGFDYELWLRFAACGRWAYAPEIRARIRRHPAAKSVAANMRTRRDEQRIRAEYWTKGGWPEWTQSPPVRQLLNFGYRARRQLGILLSFTRKRVK